MGSKELLETAPLLGSINQPQQTLKNKCVSIIQRYLPITQWLPQYSCHKLQCDMIAGITVGLMVIPQGIAYAAIAGLGPVYGLYCAFMGCFVYCLFGTSKDISIGPTAIMSLIVNQYAHKSTDSQAANEQYAILLSLGAGIIMFIMGAMRLGFVVRFISLPVISGFTSSAAIIIAVSQVKSLFGLKHVRREFVFCVYDTFKHIKETKPWDLGLGCICIIILFILRQLGRTKWTERTAARKQRIARKIIWIAGTGRNALVVLMASLVAYATVSKGHEDVFTLTNQIREGLPEFKVIYILMLVTIFTIHKI